MKTSSHPVPSHAYPLWKLSPFFSEKIWGWEKWIFSTHPNGPSTLQNGPYKGASLLEALKQLQASTHPSEQSSESIPPTLPPPVLIKIIQAHQDLSVQVHPDDAYAKHHESNGSNRGKSECWLFLDHTPQAQVISGFKAPIRTFTPPHPDPTDDIRKLFTEADASTITDALATQTVVRGGALYIPAGTVHAIGGGVKLLEVQQSSDITYRLYDYGRGRETHLESSLAVIDRTATGTSYTPTEAHFIETPYFQISQKVLKPHEETSLVWSPPESKQQTIVVGISGQFQIEQDLTGRGLGNRESEGVLTAREEDCFYAPWGGEFKIRNLEAPSTYAVIEAFSEA